MKEKKEKIIKLRISEEDYNLLYYLACNSAMTVSRYIRMRLSKPIEALRAQKRKGIITDEDIKTVCDDFVQLRKLFK